MNAIESIPSRRGSALVIAMIMIGVIAALGAASYIVLNNKYRVVHQASSWQEALQTAEAGVDMGLNEITRTLFYSKDKWWQGWESNDSQTHSTSKRELLREGEGGVKSWADVTVDAPSFLVDPYNKVQWYRIVAHGYCQISGGRTAAGTKEDLRLRKLDLTYDHRAKIDGTSGSVANPVAHRVIEAIAKPQFAFRMALFAVDKIDMTDHNILVDSFDSRDRNKSNWSDGDTYGDYPWKNPDDHKDGVNPDKQQWNGDIGTNGTVINAKDAHIYGTANTNTGGVVTGTDNITGNFPDDPNPIRTDFSMAVPDVNPPDTVAGGYSPATIDPNAGLVATTGDGTKIIVSDVTLNRELTITGEAGKETFIAIVCTGDVNITGQGKITLGAGVYLRLYVEGKVINLSGQGITNSGAALNCEIYGCYHPRDPVTNALLDTGDVTISGNAGFNGALYTPTYNVTINGGGAANKADIYGSIVGKTITMTGETSVHYDEALGDGGIVNGYSIVSWFEDER